MYYLSIIDRKGNEEYLMNKLLSKKNPSAFDTIEKEITPKALTNCFSSSLLMGMKVKRDKRERLFHKDIQETVTCICDTCRTCNHILFYRIVSYRIVSYRIISNHI